MNIIDLIFPRRCPICHDIVGTNGIITHHGAIYDTPKPACQNSSDIYNNTHYSALVCDKCNAAITRVNEPYCMKCGKPLFDTSELCSQCACKQHFFDEGRAVFVYDEIMKKSIYRFKYGNRQEYAKFYAYEIYSRYRQKIKKWNADVIIPVPLHKSKLKKRGYNQAFLIAKELSHLTKIPVNTNILYRTKKTEVQKNLDLNERSINLKNAFKMSSNKVQYCTAILIDDIYTTGATADFCAKALKSGGFTAVYILCVCIGRGN